MGSLFDGNKSELMLGNASVAQFGVVGSYDSCNSLAVLFYPKASSFFTLKAQSEHLLHNIQIIIIVLSCRLDIPSPRQTIPPRLPNPPLQIEPRLLLNRTAAPLTP